MVQTSTSQASFPTKFRLHANPAHLRLLHPTLKHCNPAPLCEVPPPHLILVPIGRNWMLYTQQTHALLAWHLRACAAAPSGAGTWTLGGGERDQAESSSVIRSYASRCPGSVGPVGSGLGAGAAVASAAAGAMEAVPEPRTQAGGGQDTRRC